MRKVIGLTGGIGSGKTVVSAVFSAFGLPVYNADIQAKKIISTNSALQNQIKKIMGERSFKDGAYNTSFVASKVFASDTLLEQLNQIIHPAVEQDFENWLGKQKANFVIKETALLFQANLRKSIAYKILVLAPENLRIERIKHRDITRDSLQIQAIIDKQGDYSKFEDLADFVVLNNDKQSVLLQVREICDKIGVEV